jgi:hypothetical protein
MSKQTNDFQRLVKLIQQALAPEGATVTESAMVESQGHAREIDVLVEGQFGPYRMKIAVEARDHSRPVGPQQVEQYIGKYREGDGIPVNQVVIVSRSGFTRSAKDKARIAGIIVYTLSEAKTADWRKFIHPNQKQTLKFGMPPHYHEIVFDPPLAIDAHAAAQRGMVRCDCCGGSNGSFLQFLEKRLASYASKDPTLLQRIRAGLKTHNGNVLANISVCGHGKTLIVDNKEYALGRIAASIHFCEAEAPLEFTLYEQTDSNGNVKTVQRAQACLAGKRIEMLMPDGLASQRIVLDIRDDCGCSGNSGASAA